jgi:hypothetical protein
MSDKDDQSLRRMNPLCPKGSSDFIAVHKAFKGLRMSYFTDNLIEECKKENETFGFGKLKEDDPLVFKRVGDYWHSIGIKETDGRTQAKSSKGKSYNPAWSSAFVSYVVKAAGAGNDAFNYTEAHCHYIEFSRKAAASVKPSAYYAVDPYSATPAVGDIICAGREYAEGLTFEQAELAYKTDSFYPSHGDIVISVNQEHGYIVTIGGNVDNSVNQKRLLISEDGILVDRSSGTDFLPWLALLRCQL